MSVSSAVYSAIFKRNYVYVGSVFAGAFAFEMLFDSTTEKIWDRLNKGRQWKDIRARYVTEDE